MANVRYFGALDEAALVDVMNNWLASFDDAIIGELLEPGSTLERMLSAAVGFSPKTISVLMGIGSKWDAL